MRRLVICVLAVLALSTAAVTTAPAARAANAPTGRVRWLTTGDSYSSGYGVPGNAGACGQSTAAWGPQAREELQAKHGWQVDNLVFTACQSHLVGDFYNRRADTGEKGSLWEWTKEQSGEPDPKFDVITMSFGGNDFDFPGVATDCVLVGVCQTRETDLLDRVNSFLRPDRFTIDDGGPGGYGHGPKVGSIADFYELMARRHLSSRGRLVVMGYPRLWAPAGEWPGWSWTMCNFVTRSSADMVGRVAEQADTVLASSVAAANRALGADRVEYISALDLWGGHSAARTGQGHEMCGAGDDWLNGVNTVTPTLTNQTGWLQQGSFHPNLLGNAAEGHAAATVLAAKGLQEGSFGPVECPDAAIVNQLAAAGGGLPVAAVHRLVCRADHMAFTAQVGIDKRGVQDDGEMLAVWVNGSWKPVVYGSHGGDCVEMDKSGIDRATLAKYFAHTSTLCADFLTTPASGSGPVSCVASSSCTLSADGWGPIRYGMTAAAALKAAGPAVHFDPGSPAGACGLLVTPTKDLNILVLGHTASGKIVALEPLTAAVKTDKGIAQGDPWSKMTAAYPTGHAGTDDAGDPFWSVRGTEGALIFTNYAEKVGHIAVVAASDADHPPAEFCA